MSTQRRAAVALAVIVAAWLAVHLATEPTDRRDLGHPGVVDAAIFAAVVLVSLTHAALGAIMWVQRSRWLPSDGAMFLFVAVKALYWATAALNFSWAGRGISPETGFFLLTILGTTVYLDARLVRRYVLLTPDEEPDGASWERRR